MVLLNISASKGQPSEMTMKSLDLGISILRGGNVDVQMVRAGWTETAAQAAVWDGDLTW